MLLGRQMRHWRSWKGTKEDEGKGTAQQTWAEIQQESQTEQIFAGLLSNCLVSLEVQELPGLYSLTSVTFISSAPASWELRHFYIRPDRLLLCASAPESVLRNTRVFTVWLRAGDDPCLLLVLAVTPNQWLDWQLCCLRVTASHRDSSLWVW